MMTRGMNIKYHLNPIMDELSSDVAGEIVEGTYRFDNYITDSTEDNIPNPDVLITQYYPPRYMMSEYVLKERFPLMDQSNYQGVSISHGLYPAVYNESFLLYERIFLNNDGLIIGTSISIEGNTSSTQAHETAIISNGDTTGDNYIQMEHKIYDSSESTMVCAAMRYFGFTGTSYPDASSPMSIRYYDDGESQGYQIQRSFESMFYNNGIGFRFQHQVDGTVSIYAYFLLDLNRMPSNMLRTGPLKGVCLEQAAHVYEASNGQQGTYEDLSSRFISL